MVYGDVNVRLGGGADNFMVTNPANSSVFFAGLTVYGSLTVDMGAGNDIQPWQVEKGISRTTQR